MGRALRMYSSNGVYFVTARTTQGRLLLRPSTETNELVGGTLARAARLYNVDVYAFVVTSNHLHLLVHVRDGALSRFMQYLLGNIARKVGKLINWTGPFWGRRFAAEPVLDDGAMINRFRYILEHGVKEGLVRAVAEWPGLNSVRQLLGAAVRTFKWFNWARRWQKGKLRPNTRGLFDEELAEAESLELVVLPCWKHLDDERRRQLVRDIIADIERAGSHTQRRPGSLAAILSRHPHTRPAKMKKSPRPHSLCHATLSSLRKEFVDCYHAFLADFRVASERFRRGDLLARFPPFAFRPPLIHPLPSRH